MGAVISPSWIPCHPKSLAAREQGEPLLQITRNAFKIFRYGHTCGFPGWNGDETTNWTTHSKKLVDMGTSNKQIRNQIEELDVTASDYEEKKKELEGQLQDIGKVGYCKPVGTDE